MEPGKTHHQPFPETRWSLVKQAKSGSPAERLRALSDLCEMYWPPVYAFIRSQGQTPHDSEDLTQAFFAQLLRREDFEKTSEEKGRLRYYLLRAVRHFLTDDIRHRMSQKRGGKNTVLSIDIEQAEARCAIPEIADEMTPERTFHRQWATTLIEHVIRDLENYYIEDEKGELFQALKPFIMPNSGPEKQGEIARQLGMSESAVRVAIHRLRHRFAAHLRILVGDTLGPEDDAEEELRELMAAFS